MSTDNFKSSGGANQNVLNGHGLNADGLNFLRDYQAPLPRWRVAIAAAGAILYHVLALLFLMFAPNPAPLLDTRQIALDLKNAVPLYLPKELTQKDPNRGKISHELDVRSAAPSAAVALARKAPGLVPAPIIAPLVTPPVVIPPTPQSPAPLRVEPPPAPKPQDKPAITDKPALAFEPVKPSETGPQPDARVKVPDTSVEAIAKQVETTARGSARQSANDSSVALGDADASRLQLLSDPNGVDFKPYLIQVLTAVRTNWLAIMPSAAMGRRGRVLVQFIIDRHGRIPKMVIAEESGTLALDRVAIAGVNASVPFPPLPPAYRGNEIRLQMTFSYNLPTH